jgi:hypothetical protein
MEAHKNVLAAVFVPLILLAACGPAAHQIFDPMAGQAQLKNPKSQARALPTDGQDLGFRYHDSSHQCLNGQGKTGLNPGYIGQCGDLSEHKIEWKLDGYDLRGADLSHAWVSPEASFRNTLLDGAQLTGASLSGTDLSGASLKDAELIQAYLGHAKLIEVDLRNANLSFAALVNADLLKADLDGALVSHISASGAKLTKEQLCRASKKSRGDAVRICGWTL